MSEQTSQNLEAIKQINIFRYLKDEELMKILAISEFETYEPEEPILEEGDIKPYFYAVLKGTVNVMFPEEAGDVFIGAIGDGEIFGEAGIFLNVKRSANIISTDSTTIVKIHRKKLLEFIKQNPSAGIKILMLIIYSLLGKLRDANQEIAFERKSDFDQGDIDSLVESFMIGDEES